jgi:ethanolamine transporter EutH
MRNSRWFHGRGKDFEKVFNASVCRELERVGMEVVIPFFSEIYSFDLLNCR